MSIEYIADARPKKPRARLKVDYGSFRSLDQLDGRQHAVKRARQAAAALIADAGGAENISAARRQLITRASVLSVYLEDTESRWLQGEQIDPADWMAAANTLKRLLCALGLERRPRDVTSFGDLLRADRAIAAE
jgi:hypothetical protein